MFPASARSVGPIPPRAGGAHDNLAERRGRDDGGANAGQTLLTKRVDDTFPYLKGAT
jgi:hypothetical protein